MQVDAAGLGVASMTWPTVTSWARKPSRRCTSVIALGGVEQVDDPVAGGVAAADDERPLARELASRSRRGSGRRGPPTGSCRSPAASWARRRRGRRRRSPCASAGRRGRCAGRRGRPPTRSRSAVVSRCTGTSNCSSVCSRSCSTRSLARILRVAGHVEDPLLRVQRRELAAELGQRVDDPRRWPRACRPRTRPTGPTGPAPMTVMSRTSSKSRMRSWSIDAAQGRSRAAARRRARSARARPSVAMQVKRRRVALGVGARPRSCAGAARGRGRRRRRRSRTRRRTPGRRGRRSRSC